MTITEKRQTHNQETFTMTRSAKIIRKSKETSLFLRHSDNIQIGIFTSADYGAFAAIKTFINWTCLYQYRINVLNKYRI